MLKHVDHPVSMTYKPDCLINQLKPTYQNEHEQSINIPTSSSTISSVISEQSAAAASASANAGIPWGDLNLHDPRDTQRIHPLSNFVAPHHEAVG